jgi:hypothetical protein
VNEFSKLKKEIELCTGKSIKAVRIDRAEENITLAKELQMYSVAIELTTAYTPSQNSIAERLNRILVQISTLESSLYSRPLNLF